MPSEYPAEDPGVVLPDAARQAVAAPAFYPDGRPADAPDDPGPIECGPLANKPPAGWLRRLWDWRPTVTFRFDWHWRPWRYRHTHYYTPIAATYHVNPFHGLCGAVGQTIIYYACMCRGREQVIARAVPGKITLTEVRLGKAVAEGRLPEPVITEASLEAVAIIRAALREVVPEGTSAPQVDGYATVVADLLTSAGLLRGGQ